MVLINDKKFACGTCIKGHRVSGCTHTDRPLFEVKKKGRPATQCQHCRDKRKNVGEGGGSSTVHTKCACGDQRPPSVILPPVTTSSAGPSILRPSPPRSVSDGSPTPFVESVETRKGVPGSNPTFPNGLKDVHDMAAAAEALHGLGTDENGLKVAERKVQYLLNPCHCATGGPCKCCQPKREKVETRRAPSPSVSSGSHTPNHSNHHAVTDSLIEMFKSKATTSSTPSDHPPTASLSSSAQPQLTASTSMDNSSPTWAQLLTPQAQFLSPEHMHHPAHTSPHVHKAKLYSPYSISGHSTPRHGPRRESASPHPTRPRAGWASSVATTRPPPPKLRPLADMNTFLGAVFKEDGTVAEEIPRSALGLPGIKAFDNMAEHGGVKIEPMEIDAADPIQFPTNEDVIIGACTCGDDCECAGCATHCNPGTNDSSHVHDGACGENCKSSFDCADHLSLPSGITSIGHLLSLAAANVPPPARPRPSELYAHDTRILPPSVHINDDVARLHGVVNLKPLECCNGRCQCTPGQCTCEKECCGCCIRCTCDEDGDSKMRETGGNSSTLQGSCCSTAPAPIAPSQQTQAQVTFAELSISSNPSSTHITPPGANSRGLSSPHLPASTALVPPPPTLTSRQPSPQPPASGTKTPPHPQPASTIRRSASTQGQGSHGAVSGSRRATVTAAHGSTLLIQRSTSTGKQASKALALHANPNHPHSHSHPRPILPKPPANGHLSLPKSSGSEVSRVPPPANQHTGASSIQASKNSSPTTHPVQQPPTESQQPHFQVPEASLPNINAPSLPNMAQSANPHNAMSGNDDMYNLSMSDLMTDEEFLAYINSLALRVDPNSGLSIPPPPTSSSEESIEPPLVTPDLSMGQSGGVTFGLGTNLQGTSTDGMGDFVMDQDLFTMLNNAMVQAPSNTTQPPDPHSTSLQNTSLTNPFQSQTDLSLARSTPPKDGQSNARNLGLRLGDEVGHVESGFALTMADFFLATLSDTAQSQSPASNAEPDGPVYRQLPPQSSAFLQQMFAQNPSMGTTTNSMLSMPDGGGSGDDGTKASTMGGSNGGDGSNMIDLSKPLNSSDVERILRSLQEQQARQDNNQGGGEGGGVSHPARLATNSARDQLNAGQTSQGQISNQIHQPLPQNLWSGFHGTPSMFTNMTFESDDADITSTSNDTPGAESETGARTSTIIPSLPAPHVETRRKSPESLFSSFVFDLT